MTSGIPRRSASRSGSPLRTAPRSLISRDALYANLNAALSASTTGLIDGRADAWGHGLLTLTRAALDAGALGVVVDEPGAAALDGLVASSSWMRAAQAPPIDEASSDLVYGLSEGGLSERGLSEGVRPVMRLLGQVLSLKRLYAGEGVSYGFTHRASTDTTVALVTGGYAQGIVRSLGNAADVAIAGQRHRIVGRVAMDVCVVDVGEASVSPGDEVVFFGEPRDGSPTLHEWVAATGLTAAELVTTVGLRTQREVVA